MGSCNPAVTRGCSARARRRACSRGCSAWAGGFIIVPALVFVTGTAIHRAVATSLLVIFLISISGVAAHLLHGAHFPPLLSALFVGGGFAGMLAGSRLRTRLPPARLRQVFAAGMWIVGAYMLWRNVPALFHP